MTARSCRYWGSGAVMMSELVAGSAWIWPPVLGPSLPWSGALAPPLPAAPMPPLPPVPPKPPPVFRLVANPLEVAPALRRPPPDAGAATLPPDMAALSVAASATALAFFR